VIVSWIGTARSGAVSKKKDSFCTVAKIKERIFKGHQESARVIACAYKSAGRIASLDGRALGSLLTSLEKGSLRDVVMLQSKLHIGKIKGKFMSDLEMENSSEGSRRIALNVRSSVGAVPEDIYSSVSSSSRKLHEFLQRAMVRFLCY